MRPAITTTTTNVLRPFASISRRSLYQTTCVRSDKDDGSHKVAKKHVGKIRDEEANKEKHPSPISPEAREKLSEMEKKADEHDKKSKQ
ncbi:hypothetical protein BDB00DRAFT_872036 [Zychaea mexicana]|uniref:uncharacterized protein n=1 Tax=Zychaea mexicana TaxID=64656 RepID=UPI0022FE2C9D|nr:uncharacterized protein BDB00DRAFT_872036 [Zychaea mexicana]KAI9493793.1 hypothetical protein BDB00DRAFT_872036 [Zychaea mexicana]